MIESVIFDMDGLIINSEPLWEDAMIAMFKEYDISVSRKELLNVKGFRVDEAIVYINNLKRCSNSLLAEQQKLTIKNITTLIKEKGEALPGVLSTINYCKIKNIPIAIASSSLYEVIDATINRLNLNNHFNVVYSAQDEERGKPHPGIFISTAKKMDVNISNCIIFEDSVNGVIAARAAGAIAVAVPDSSHFDNPQFSIAHHKLKSMEEAITIINSYKK